MSHYRPYSKYKPSGVDWLGDVPAHWRVDRLKVSIASSQNGIWGEDPKGDLDDIPCVRVADFDRDHLCVQNDIPTLRSITQKERAGRILQKGDLLLEKSGGGEKQPVGQVVRFQLDIPAVSSNFIARMSLTPGMNSDFWNYVHAALYFGRRNTLAINQTSGIQNLDQDRYFNERVTIPPLNEQAEIAKNLKQETLRIDALISSKTRFIELLQEKRQALITRAVTKGLDPSVKMKGSGIDWIGEIPEHWSVLPIKYIAKIGNGSTPRRDETRYWEGGHFPWLTSSCVNEEHVESADQFITDAALRECHLPIVAPPAVLVGITGQGKTRGMATTLGIRATVNQHLAFLCPDSHVVRVDFLRRVIDAAYEWLRDESDGVGGTRGAITCENLGDTRVGIPPVDEQQSIVEYLERTSRRLADLSEKTQESVRLLAERRSALITAAVTGQIDLRGAA